MLQLGEAMVSTHAPAKGATAIFYGGICRQMGFNSRPREGGDDVDAKQLTARKMVSTHAPAKGATP